MALSLMLRRPEWFAAAISLNGPLHATARLDQFGAYGKKPVFLGDIGYDFDPRMSRSTRMLHTAGFDVTTRQVDFASPDVRELQKSLDAWLLPRLCPTAIV